MKVKKTPQNVALGIRSRFEKNIATTWADYAAAQARRGFWLDANRAALMVQEQIVGCCFETAADAVAAAVPELFGNYWVELLTKKQAAEHPDHQPDLNFKKARAEAIGEQAGLI